MSRKNRKKPMQITPIKSLALVAFAAHLALAGCSRAGEGTAEPDGHAHDGGDAVAITTPALLASTMTASEGRPAGTLVTAMPSRQVSP